MSENSAQKTQEYAKVDPMFNASIEYLKLLMELMRRAHDKSISRDLNELFNTLENLDICVEPRIQLYYEDVRDAREVCESNYKNGLIDENVSTQYAAHAALKKWFRVLSMAIHRSGLLMQDKPDMMEATKL